MIILFNKVIITISFLCITLLYITNLLPSYVILIYALFINSLLMVKHLNNPIIYIVNFMFFSILLYLIPTYFLDFPLTEFYEYNKQFLYDKVLFIHIVFLYFLYLFIPLNKHYIPLNLVINKYNYSKVFWFLYIIVFISIVFGMSGSIVMFQEDSYAIYKENLSVESGLPEYLLILFVLMFVFMTTKTKEKMLILLTIIYLIKLFLLGYRIQFIMGVLFLYFSFIDGKINIKTMVYSSFLGFIFSLIYGNLKAGITDLSISKLFIDFGYGFVMSHQSNMYYSTTVYIGLIENGLMSLEMRFVSFIGFFLNMIIPSRFIKEYIPAGQIPTWAHQFATYGGGGLPDVYFFIWLGYIGIILFALYLAFLFKLSYNKFYVKTKFRNILLIYLFMIIITSPRWVFYDPGNFLFRLPIYTILLLLIIRGIMSKAKEYEKN